MTLDEFSESRFHLRRSSKHRLRLAAQTVVKFVLQTLLLLLFISIFTVESADAEPASKPNVLFIAIDDLNDWVGCMGGHPQARTPHIDRLAASGVLFTNAHCPAPACNPSRTAIMCGIAPNKSGVYDNRQKMRELLPNAELIPKYFSRHGYWSAGSGKMLHYFTDAPSWDEYFPPKETEDPFPRTLYPEVRPVSLPRGGPWQYIETDWGPLDVSDEEFGGDWLVSKWVGEQLAKEHKKPFFLACGIYRPHEPWFVPKKYFDLFPLADIQLPVGYRKDDLEDLPPAGQERGPNRYFDHIREQKQWKQAIQGYLASIAFADAMLGRVLKALEKGPHRDNTIVVLWSDHGWHLGEKQHWQKFTGWRVCTRVPLIVRVPKDTVGLPEGTKAGTRCDQPTNLLSLYPTLTQLAGLPDEKSNDGPSLVPLLEQPDADWPHLSVTHLNRPNNYSISGKRWRYIHYDNGDQELYDIEADPFEWQNLASSKEHADQIGRLRAYAPTEFEEYAPASVAALPKLKWFSAKTSDVPTSRVEGEAFEVVFTNSGKVPVKIFGVAENGKRQSFGTIQSGWGGITHKSRPGTVLLITDIDENELGHFMVGDRRAHAIIPPLDHPKK